MDSQYAPEFLHESHPSLYGSPHAKPPQPRQIDALREEGNMDERGELAGLEIRKEGRLNGRGELAMDGLRS
jgi:hypothetical protein